MKPTVRIFKDTDELNRAAAEIFIELAAQAIRERGQFLVAFSGGSTPTVLYRLLARESVDWTRVHVFWGDERLVPPDDPQSNYGQAHKALLKHVPIPTENVHRVVSEMEPAAAAMDYALTLKRFASPPLDWPRFDLVLLGMGEDGHTASLFPGSSVDMTEPVIAVTAHYQGRPAERVTLTPLVFNSAREIMFLVAGAGKAVTLSHVLNDISPVQYPAQRIRPTDGKVTWMVDDAAGQKINREEAKAAKVFELREG